MTAAVRILRFRVGSLHVALDAAAVAEIARTDGTAPHLAQLIDSSAAPAGPTSTHDSPQRLLRLRDRYGAVAFVVDGPVTLAQVTVRDIAPVTSMTMTLGAILGYARLGPDVLTLLDLASLSAIARAHEPR
jgi:hypothetical protein